MTRIHTSEDFIDAISRELLWRKREISELFLLVKRADKNATHQKMLIRCSIPIYYAHWEGFVKKSSSIFFELIVNKKHSFKEVLLPLQATSVRRVLRAALTAHDFAKYHSTIAMFSGDANCEFNCNYESIIDTSNNLDSNILKRIVLSLNLDYREYETKEKFIDDVLLHYRNNISHGKEISLDFSAFTELHNTVLELINLFRNQLENMVVQGSYLRKNG